MQFNNPSFLWALLALMIPIIIHLFHFRRYNKVYFSNVKMLQEIKDEKSVSNRVKHLLVLASRLLALAALIFAFAQPFIPSKNEVKKGNFAVSIFVDNSFSMNNTQDDIPILDIAKEKARQIVKAYSQEDRFQVLSQEMYGRSQRMLTQAEAINAINGINISAASKTFNQILNRQKQAINGKENNETMYILSDFPEHYLKTDFADTTQSIHLLPLQHLGSQNVGIDTAYLESPVSIPNEINKIIVSIKNYSQKDVEGIRLSSNIDTEEKPEGIHNIPAGQSVKDTILVKLGLKEKTEVILKIEDYPITFDNEYFLVLDNPKTINVLSIYNQKPNKYLSALLNGIQIFQHQKQAINNVDYNGLSSQDLIILEDLNVLSSGLISALNKYVEQGGNLLIFPSAKANIEQYNQLSNTLKIDQLSHFDESQKAVSRVNTEEFVFQNVFEKINKNTTLPSTKGSFNIFKKSGENLLTFRDGKPYLRKHHNQGYVYFSIAPLNPKYNNLALRAEIFVPMIFKIAIHKGNRLQTSYTLGKHNNIALPNAETPESVYEIKGEKSFIPQQKNIHNQSIVSVNNEIEKAGFYTINQREKSVEKLAFNHNRKESQQKSASEDELQKLAQSLNADIVSADVKNDFSAYIEQQQKGIPLWKWFLIAALLFLLIEIFLLKYWRT